MTTSGRESSASRASSVKDFISRSFDHRQKGRLAEAEAVLLEGLGQYPADIYLQTALGEVYLRQNRVSEAEHLAKDVLARRPDHVRAVVLLGNAYYRRRNYARAREQFEAATAADPSPYILRCLAECYLRTGEPDRAIDLCRQELESQPEDNEARVLLARAYERKGDPARALELYREVSERDPGQTWAYQRYLKLSADGRDRAETVREIGRMYRVGTRESNPHLHIWRGDECRKLGNYPEAAAEYRRALELAPGNRYVQKQLAFCYYRQGDTDRAVPLLKEIVLYDPSDYFARSSLIAGLTRLGRAEEALRVLEEALNRHPDCKALWGPIRKLAASIEDAPGNAGKRSGASKPGSPGKGEDDA